MAMVPQPDGLMATRRVQSKVKLKPQYNWFLSVLRTSAAVRQFGGRVRITNIRHLLRFLLSFEHSDVISERYLADASSDSLTCS